MAEIIVFPGWTRLPLPVERVLEGATACTSVLVLGEDADGRFYAAASVGDGHTLLWWIETFRHKLLSGDYAGG
jgi:hypothetical protein